MLNEPNANEESKRNGIRHYTDDDIKYGWFSVRPGFMQLLLKPILCLLVLVGCCSTQGELEEFVRYLRTVVCFGLFFVCFFYNIDILALHKNT